MKKIIFSILVCCTTLMAKAQRAEHFTFATNIGTAIPLNKPAATPFTWQMLGYYAISKRFETGVGTGLSFYEKVLVPLFATAKFTLVKPRKFTPYLECGVGYSFAPDKNANGGFYLNPSVGIQYPLGRNKKLFVAFGYELQKFERLKSQEQPLFTAAFAEKLKHSAVSVKTGFRF